MAAGRGKIHSANLRFIDLFGFYFQSEIRNLQS